MNQILDFQQAQDFLTLSPLLQQQQPSLQQQHAMQPSPQQQQHIDPSALLSSLAPSPSGVAAMLPAAIPTNTPAPVVADTEQPKYVFTLI